MPNQKPKTVEAVVRENIKLRGYLVDYQDRLEKIIEEIDTLLGGGFCAPEKDRPVDPAA